MIKKEDLSRAEMHCLSVFQDTGNFRGNFKHPQQDEAYVIGKEIHESIQPEPWKPKVVGKSFHFDESSVWHGKGDSIRQAPTQKLAERRLKNERILNTINAWILENRNYGVECNNQIYLPPKGVWSWNPHLGAVNSEYCDADKSKELCELLNAGLIHGVPAKMEV
jgi:hypothetical protein